MSSILFVCSANQCRSPMAEGLFKQLLKEKGLYHEWWVESAGAWAEDGAQPTSYAVAVMKERGIDISTHLSQLATPHMMRRFDRILMMERRHLDYLAGAAPSLAGRMAMFRSLVGEEDDFADPVGGSLDRYRHAASELERILRKGLENLVPDPEN
jgi:protein-tyrosine-phosphatase